MMTAKAKPRFYRAEEYGDPHNLTIAGWVGYLRADRTRSGRERIIEEMVPVLAGATCPVVPERECPSKEV